MRRISLLAAACVLILADPASAQSVARTHVFPIVAHNEGAGQPPTQWATDLVINNLRARTVVVGMQFFPMGQANEIDPSFPNRISLDVRETVMFEDVLSTRFGYDESITGMMIVTTDPNLMPGTGNSDNDKIVATTRTYNVGSPQGTFGQTVPSNPVLHHRGPQRRSVQIEPRDHQLLTRVRHGPLPHHDRCCPDPRRGDQDPPSSDRGAVELLPARGGPERGCDDRRSLVGPE